MDSSSHSVQGDSSVGATPIDSENVRKVGAKRGRSPYWDHCEKVKKEVGGRISQTALCNYCNAEIRADPGKNGTSSLRYHLSSVCKKSPLYKIPSPGQAILSNELMGGGGSLVSHVFNQKRCELKVVEFVIRDEMSFRTVEGAGYLAMMHEVQPKLKIPNRKKIASMVFDLYLVEKAKLASMMNGHRVSITTDTWTSIQNINYMVVTAHFIDSEWRLQKKIINFVKITSHKGDDIGRCLESCLRDWGIEKVFTIVVDNASANDTAIEYIKKRFRNQKTLLFDGKYLHLRCTCHIINLIVKDGLKELKGSIKAIRNAVHYIHTSPARLHTFREFSQLEKFDKMATVPQDVKTRWNSTYKMLEGALKYKRVFERMGEECVPYQKWFEEIDEKNSKRVGPPCDEDWANALAFSHFLVKFYECTLKLSATKAPSANVIFYCLIAIYIEIERKLCMPDPILQRVALSMKQKFDKYWGSFEGMNPLIFVANVLDPRNKLQVITVSLRKTGNHEETVDFLVSRVKQYLLSLWNEYSGIEGRELRGSNEKVVEERNCDVDIFDEINGDVDLQNQEDELQEISNEVDKYLSDPFESRKKLVGFNLLDWWRDNKTRYPVLSQIAKDILAIPSSTVASESAFSLGKRVVDPFRSLLSPKMVQALVCTNDWLRPNEFSVYKDPTDSEVELCKEIEEIELNAMSF